MRKKDIKLFEAFAGIGSQFKALKKVAKEKKWSVISVGIIEWYIDAIIAYLQIHYFEHLKTIPSNWKQKLDLNKLTLSNDSKKPISTKYLNKLINALVSTHTASNQINNLYKIFSYIYNSKLLANNLFDIKNVTYKDIPKGIDIFTYSFPCQDLSIQGKQSGMNKNSNTRSSLLWEIERILKDVNNFFNEDDKPKYLLLENVKNIIGANHIDSYNLWINFLKKNGYESKTYVLNAINFGSAQNRERTFCLSVLKSFKKKVKFSFPDLENVKKKSKNLNDILTKNNFDSSLLMPKLSKYKLTPKQTSSIGIKKSTLIGYSKFNSESYVYYPDGIGPTLTASGANSRIKLVLNDQITKPIIRKMSAQECYQYMGFDKSDYEKVKASNLLTNEKIIYTAGNSIPIEILIEIFRSLRF